MMAATNGHESVVSVLLENEADVNAGDGVCILWMNTFVWFLNYFFVKIGWMDCIDVCC